MFYEKLIENRKKLGLTPEDLASYIKVSVSTVHKWESGISMPDLNNVIKLSELFNVSTDYLLKDRKSDSDFSYYTIEPKKVKKQLSRLKLASVFFFVVSIIALFTAFVIAWVEPIIYTSSSGKEYGGLLAYCLSSNEFLSAIVFIIIVLVLAFIILIVPDGKLRKIFTKK